LEVALAARVAQHDEAHLALLDPLGEGVDAQHRVGAEEAAEGHHGLATLDDDRGGQQRIGGGQQESCIAAMFLQEGP
jgi:hypothetical protein